MKASMLGVSALAVALFGSAYAAPDEAKPAASAAGSASVSTDKASSDRASSDRASGAQAASAKSDARSSEARAEGRGGRLTKPWRDLTSLTDDQKKQIAAIHRKAVEETNKIEDREKADIMALLNEQQKSELKSIQEKDAADRKARTGNRTAARSGSNSDKKQ